MLTEIPGITVGHWTDEQARTGCTVVRFPEGTVASGEVRGGAPATREFALLDPTMLVQRLDAVEWWRPDPVHRDYSRATVRAPEPLARDARSTRRHHEVTPHYADAFVFVTPDDAIPHLHGWFD